MDKHIGEKHGVYTIIDVLPSELNGKHKSYVVECECGERKISKYSNISYANTAFTCPHWLVYGDVKIKSNRIKNKRLANIFYGMLRRCYDTNDKSYRFYGDKGTEICQEWIDKPELFEEWALNNGYKNNLTIDRIDPKLNYCADNCRWVTLEYNSKYKSTTRVICVDNESHTGREWANILLIGANVINTHVRKYGIDSTVELIKRIKAVPELKKFVKSNISFHQVYINKFDFYINMI